MRVLVSAVIVIVSGCQCFVPVSEDGGFGGGVVLGGGSATGGGAVGGGGGALGGGSATGGGATGGAGGGSVIGGGTGGGTGGGPTGGGGARDAGPGVPCSTPSQCMGPVDPVLTYCSAAGGAWSCAFGECVRDCGPGRTCVQSDAGCMTCDGVTTCTAPGNCPFMTHLHVEASTCGVVPDTLLRVTSLSSQVCTYAVEAPDGGTWGTVTFFGYNDVSANLPSLGGPCVGGQLPTGAIRFSVGCSDCMLSVRPEVVGP